MLVDDLVLGYCALVRNGLHFGCVRFISDTDEQKEKLEQVQNEGT